MGLGKIGIMLGKRCFSLGKINSIIVFYRDGCCNDSAKPERSAGLDACGEIDADANAEESSNFACRIARNL